MANLTDSDRPDTTCHRGVQVGALIYVISFQTGDTTCGHCPGCLASLYPGETEAIKEGWVNVIRMDRAAANHEAEVGITVLRDIGHFFGLDERQLEHFEVKKDSEIRGPDEDKRYHQGEY